MTEPAHGRPPLVLIANAQEWSARSLETILGPAGFAVLRAYTDRNALDRARHARPDVIILDQHLPDRGGLEVCKELRTDPQVTPSTPIIISTAGPTTRQQRVEAMRAGAAEFIGQPLDGEEFTLRLQSYVRAKFDADRARDESDAEGRKRSECARDRRDLWKEPGAEDRCRGRPVDEEVVPLDRGADGTGNGHSPR